jgi:hypothetical protein
LNSPEAAPLDRKAYLAAYYQRNKARLNAYRATRPRKSGAGDPKQKERNRRHYEANRPALKAASAAYYDENKDEILARQSSPEGLVQRRKQGADRSARKTAEANERRVAARARAEERRRT